LLINHHNTMKNIFSFLMLIAISTTAAFAQSSSAPKTGTLTKPHNHAQHSAHERCGYKAVTDQMLLQDPAYAQKLQLARQAAEIISAMPAEQLRTPNAVIEVPVVFHIIHNGVAVGTGRNIADARITGQMEVINADFRGQNSNWTSGTPAVFQNLKADVEVHFCLAKTDPTGAASTGITRHNLADPVATASDPVGSNDTNTRLKAGTKWDPTKYLNIYIVAIPGTDAFGGTIGYSYVPTTGLPGITQDGIVMDYRWVGKAGQAGMSGGGRSLTHEIGHYLGLAHIWADYQNAGGCAADDGIADTPEQNDATANNVNFNCALGVPPVSCGSQDMYVNYMDYLNDDDCYSMFSLGQKAVMLAVLNGTAAQFGLASRLSLKNSGLTQCTACTMTAATTKVNQTCAALGSATAAVTNPPTGTVTYAWSNNATTATASNLTAGTYTVTASVGTTCLATATAVILNTCAARCDTVSNFNLALDSLRLYGAGAAATAGFVAGNNQYGDKAKADYFDLSTSANTHLKGFYMGFGYAKDAAPATNINLRVWNANGTAGAPSTVLATKSVSLSSIVTAVAAQNYLQYYELATPLALPAGKKIYIGADLPTTTGDTLVLLTNQVGAEAAGEGGGWEQNSASVWSKYVTGWGVELSNLIVAVTGTLPNAVATGATTAVCNTPITYGSAGTTNAGTYRWVASGGTVATPNAATTTITYPAAGTFTVRLITTNDCMIDTSNIITTVVTCPTTCTLSLTPFPSSTTCNLANGIVDLNVTGGTPPYTYLWSNNATTSAITGLAAGTYTVTVTAGAGCTRTATAIVQASNGINITSTTTPTTCGLANGSATVTPSGVVGSYTFAWSGGGTTNSITGRASGVYTVTVTVTNGCTKTATVTIVQSTGITATTTTTAQTCAANGSATVTATGGTTYTYVWSNAATTATATNLVAGTYTVTVTSTNTQCTKTATAIVTNACNPCAYTVTATPTATTCGLSNGSATVVMSGVAANTYTQVWSNAATTATINNVAAGTYTVTITLVGNTCTKTATVTVAASVRPTVTTTATGVLCNGALTGTATANVTPAGTYTYTWSGTPTQTTQTAINLAAGSRTVTVTSTPGCTATANAIITAPPVLSGQTTSTPQTQAQSNGTATATASGGVAPYLYIWSNNATTATITGLVAGTYTVTISDANQCSVTRSVTVALINATNEIQGFNNLLLYPNPVAQNLMLLGDFAQSTTLNISVTDAVGKTMYTNSLESVTHLNLSVPFQDYPEGVYFVTFRANNGMLTRKVVHLK
jgi:Pregnancy-associated plasma protein-A/Secretion system C-terminal sorting domain/SprB repeat